MEMGKKFAYGMIGIAAALFILPWLFVLFTTEDFLLDFSSNLLYCLFVIGVPSAIMGILGAFTIKKAKTIQRARISWPGILIFAFLGVSFVVFILHGSSTWSFMLGPSMLGLMEDKWAQLFYAVGTEMLTPLSFRSIAIVLLLLSVFLLDVSPSIKGEPSQADGDGPKE